MIKIYEFNYDDNATCTFEVDLDKFTPKMAMDTLDFFTWEYPYEKHRDPIDEVMKKYAMLVFEKSSRYFFEDIKNTQFEGYYRMNGKDGILLKSVDDFEFDEGMLNVKISVKKQN